MKRSWMGLALLVLLLGISAGVTVIMERIHAPIAADLEQAAVYAYGGDWDRAQEYSQQAEAAWEKWNHLRSSLADHAPVEDIDAGLAAMQVYRAAREAVSFCAACADLSRQIQAVGDAHGLVWWNIM